eukprot:5718235-Lingulodinium_polyedra.AAC.1
MGCAQGVVCVAGVCSGHSVGDARASVRAHLCAGRVCGHGIRSVCCGGKCPGVCVAAGSGAGR